MLIVQFSPICPCVHQRCTRAARAARAHAPARRAEVARTLVARLPVEHKKQARRAPPPPPAVISLSFCTMVADAGGGGARPHGDTALSSGLRAGAPAALVKGPQRERSDRGGVALLSTFFIAPLDTRGLTRGARPWRAAGGTRARQATQSRRGVRGLGAGRAAGGMRWGFACGALRLFDPPSARSSLTRAPRPLAIHSVCVRCHAALIYRGRGQN